MKFALESLPFAQEINCPLKTKSSWFVYNLFFFFKMNKRQDERGVAFTLGAKIRETGEREFTSVLGVFIIFLELENTSNEADF